MASSEELSEINHEFPLSQSERAYLLTKKFEFHERLGSKPISPLFGGSVWRCTQHSLSDPKHPNKPLTLVCKIWRVKLTQCDFTEGANRSSLHNMIREMDIFSSLRHKNVVEGKYVVRVDSQVTLSAFIKHLEFMEYCWEGSLQQKIDSRGENLFTEEEVRPVLYDMCQGLIYLHERGIVHLYIDPSNVMVAKDSAGNEFYKLREYYSYIPAGAQRDEGITSDGYAIGSTLLHLVCGQRVANCQTYPWQEIQTKVSKEAYSLCRSTCQFKWSDRPRSVTEILSHEWFKGFKR